MNRLRVSLGIVAALLLVVPPVVRAQLRLQIIGRCPTTVCAGDSVVCVVRFVNKSTPGTVLMVSEMRGTVLNPGGRTSDSGNLIVGAELLPTFGSAHEEPMVAPSFSEDIGGVIRVRLFARAEEVTTGAPLSGFASRLIEVEDCGPPG